MSYIELGDCLEKMNKIPDGSVDMILCDLPYGITSCKWDEVIPFDELWEQYKRIIKDNGAILLFGTEPFASKCRMSNQKMYKYDWIWKKTVASNFVNCNRQPLKKHEVISVFYFKQPTYNPQMREGKPYIDKRNGQCRNNITVNDEQQMHRKPINNTGTRYPSTVLSYSNGNNNRLHPTQKPVALLEYLIKTYTNEGETVLDNCMGSGSTCVAAINTNREYIGIELDETYFNIAKERIERALLDKEGATA